jgi:hypothetical protein
MRSGAETIGNFSLEYIVKKQQLYDVTEIVPKKSLPILSIFWMLKFQHKQVMQSDSAGREV